MNMKTHTILTGFCLLLACGLSGCLNTDPVVDSRRHFVLNTGYTEPDERDAEGAFHQVGLKRIVLPGYLHDNRLTVRKTSTELIYLEQDRWAGRPDKVLADFIASQLETKLESATVQQAPWARGSVDYELGIKFINCEVTIDGLAVVRAEWQCTGRAKPENTLTGTRTVKKQGPKPLEATPEAISTLSQAIAELIESIAKTVQTCIEES